MAAPTYVNKASIAWTTATTDTPVSCSSSLTTLTGDILVALGAVATENSVSNGVQLALGGGGSWTALATEFNEAVDNCVAAVSHQSVASGSTLTPTVTYSVNVGSTGLWGTDVLQFRSSDGIGATASNGGTGAPSLSITTTQANSAVVVIFADWNAADGASRAWLSSNGAPTEVTYFRSASDYTVYIARYNDVGAAGAKTVGLSGPGGQKWVGIAVEIKGTAGGGDTTAPVLTSPTGVATSSTAATVGATTDEGNGTMYGIASSSATVPTKAQIKAGQDHTGSAAAGAGNVAVSSTGAKTVNITGLTPGSSYYPHVVHADAAGNDSNIVSGSQWTQLVKKVKLKLVLAAAGETVDGIVWANQAGGIAGAEIGEFTSQTIGTGSGADTGLAVLKVPVSVFGGGSLSVGDTVQVYVRKPDLSKDSDVFPATVIEE